MFRGIIWIGKYIFRILFKKGKDNIYKYFGVCWKDIVCEMDIKDRI